MEGMTQDPGTSLVTYKKQFEQFGEVKREEAKEQRKAWRYYHGNQWTPEELRILGERKQPVVTANRIRRKIDGLVGLDSRYRQDPKAYGRTQKHEAEADVATATIRFVMDNNDWSMMTDECILDLSVSGVMVAELDFAEDEEYGETKLVWRRGDSERFFYDPRSLKHDFSDARYLGTWAWIDVEEAAELFPDKAESLRASAQTALESKGWSDRDKEKRFQWFDAAKGLVKIVEMWHKRGGTWYVCFFCGTNILLQAQSPFLDMDGKPAHRYEAQSAFVDEMGDRYGLVRDMISPQDEINHRRSKLLHQLSVRQTWGRSGAVKDVNKARVQLARPDGHLEVDGEFGTDWGLLDQAQQMQGQAELLREAKDEIENFGPNQALIGQNGVSDSSGRAIALLQAAGMAELALFYGRIRSWKLRVYKRTWQNIRKVWTAERTIRVTDDPQSPALLQINQLQVDEYGQPFMQNALSQINVDIIIDESPDTVNLQSETFDKFVKLAGIGIQLPPEAMIELADLDTKIKQRVLARMQEAAQAEANNPMQQMAQQLALAGQEAEIGLTQANMEKASASAFKDTVQAQRALVEPIVPPGRPAA